MISGLSVVKNVSLSMNCGGFSVASKGWFTSSFYACQYTVRSIIKYQPISVPTCNFYLWFTVFSVVQHPAQFDIRDDGNDITEILYCWIKSGSDAFNDTNPAFETSYQKHPITKGKGSVHTNKLCYGLNAIYSMIQTSGNNSWKNIMYHKPVVWLFSYSAEGL